MAKRVPTNEKPYQPVDEALVSQLLAPTKPAATPAPPVAPSPASLGPPFLPKDPPIDSSSNVVDLPKSRKARPTPPKTSEPRRRLPKSEIEDVASSEPPEEEEGETSTGQFVREKRVLLAEPEEAAINEFVNRLGAALKTPVKLSHILRASMTLLLHSEERIIERAQKSGPLKRPPNNAQLELIQYEHALARILDAAVKTTPPLK